MLINSAFAISLILFPLLVDNPLFDASQYAFFGKEDVELGDLEDNEGDNCSFIRIDDEYHFPTITDREEVVPPGAQNANEVP